MKRPLALAAAVLAFAPAAAPSATGDPLVGLWRYGDGTVRVVRHANGSFTGTVGAPLRFAACPHPADEAMWRLWGKEGRYSGRQLSFGARPGCGLRVPLAASIRVGGRALELRVARRQGLQPGACGAFTDCYRLTRVGKAPAPAPPASEPPSAPKSFDLLANGVPSSGRPQDPSYSSSSAAGRIVLDGTGSFLFFDTYTDRSELVAVRVEAIASAAADRVTARVRVSRSTLPGCKAGATGTLAARDGADRITLAVCGFTRTWTGAASVIVRGTASRP